MFFEGVLIGDAKTWPRRHALGVIKLGPTKDGFFVNGLGEASYIDSS